MPLKYKESYFNPSYQVARRHFIKLAQNIPGAELGFFEVPSKQDNDLYIDFCYLPPKIEKQSLVVILSGVHGLEGAAGSAIQKAFLEQVVANLQLKKTGCLLVHAMNPYGFKHHKRGTENYINLNRNFLFREEDFLFENPKSIEFTNHFIPREPVSSLCNIKIKNFRVVDGKIFFEDISFDELVKTVGVGQFQDITGLEYGGSHWEPQVIWLKQFLKERSSHYKSVFLFDIHTGLGDIGHLHLLDGSIPNAVQMELYLSAFKAEEDKDLYQGTPSEEEGFYPTKGSSSGILAPLLKQDQKSCSLVWEFGTLGHHIEALIEGTNRWFVEHQGLHYGYRDKQLENEVLELYRERFLPKDTSWKENVFTKGVGTLYRIFERIEEREAIR